MKAQDKTDITRKQPSDKRQITPIIHPHTTYDTHDSNLNCSYRQSSRWSLRGKATGYPETKHTLSVNTHHVSHSTGNLVDVQLCRHVSSSDNRTDAFSCSLFSLFSERGAVAGG